MNTAKEATFLPQWEKLSSERECRLLSVSESATRTAPSISQAVA